MIAAVCKACQRRRFIHARGLCVECFLADRDRELDVDESRRRHPSNGPR